MLDLSFPVKAGYHCFYVALGFFSMHTRNNNSKKIDRRKNSSRYLPILTYLFIKVKKKQSPNCPLPIVTVVTQLLKHCWSKMYPKCMARTLMWVHELYSWNIRKNAMNLLLSIYFKVMNFCLWKEIDEHSWIHFFMNISWIVIFMMVHH